ncbi:hypothetical protein diail_11377 [Diaporthe ilicicola]|nr:hypothetical protein diail_11377 [Diaporthe ilicicola]
MQLSTGLWFCLGNLAAVGLALHARADVELACYAVDPTGVRTLQFNSQGLCSSDCESAGYSVFAVQGASCVCLDSPPADDKKADASKCDEPCPGYAFQICGGVGYYSVGTIDGAYSNSSDTEPVESTSTATATTASVSNGTSSATSSSTTPATTNSSSPNLSPNSTVSVTAPSVPSSSGSAATTTESSAALPTFKKDFSTIASVLSVATALLAFV